MYFYLFYPLQFVKFGIYSQEQSKGPKYIKACQYGTTYCNKDFLKNPSVDLQINFNI